MSPAEPPGNEPPAGRFLVCGLGSLGQFCAANLKEFGAEVIGIDSQRPAHWEVPHLPALLTDLVIDDCRRPEVLTQAGIQGCRAVLLVTSDDRVNIETAFAARLANPQVRLVMRSAKESLANLLGEQLGNFIAYEPTQLPALAFALASLEEDILGFFELDGEPFQVVQRTITPEDPWCNRRRLYELQGRTRRVLAHWRPGQSAAQEVGINLQLQTGDPSALLQAGDVVVLLEAGELSWRPAAQRPRPKSAPWQSLREAWLWLRTPKDWRQLWLEGGTRRVALGAGGFVITLLVVGTLLFRLGYPDIPLDDAFFASATLLLGGYGDVFGDLVSDEGIPWWLRLFSLLLTLAGIALVGVIYALLTENLLSSQFKFLDPRPAVPERDHVVIVGLGRVGRQVADLLQQLRQPVVGITNQTLDASVLPQMAILRGDTKTVIGRANLATARSILTVTDDELENLEVALWTRQSNPRAGLVIRTFDPNFSDNVARLFPYAQVLNVYSLAAEAFAGAAFGENILSLFRLDQDTILVTEYQIEADDTLVGKLCGEIAYGYGVVPCWFQSPRETRPTRFPSDDLRLHPGDRLVLLATSDSLQRIERGDMAPRTWRVAIERILTQEAQFYGGNVVAQITGCSLEVARHLMTQPPGTPSPAVYYPQAHRLVQELAKVQVIGRLIPP